VDRRSSKLSFVRAVPAALLLALAVPGVAQADATLSVTGTAPHQTLTYTVDDALDHTTMPLIMSGDLRIDDNVGIASGCAPVGGNFDCGPAADFERIVFAFGDGDDHLDLLQWDMSIAVLANGGGGDDVLEGGVVGDELTGGPGDDELYGADGDDVLTGGEGNDYLSGGPGVDHFDGGEGDDHLSTVDTPAAADLSISCGAGDDVAWTTTTPTGSTRTARRPTRRCSTARSGSPVPRGRASSSGSRCPRTSAAMAKPASSGSAATLRVAPATTSMAPATRRTRSQQPTWARGCVRAIGS
jgi:hypothetical protein